ncbi:MAG: glycosyltransferase family 39 protein [Gemmataceae bacterium]
MSWRLVFPFAASDRHRDPVLVRRLLPPEEASPGAGLLAEVSREAGSPEVLPLAEVKVPEERLAAATSKRTRNGCKAGRSARAPGGGAAGRCGARRRWSSWRQPSSARLTALEEAGLAAQVGAVVVGLPGAFLGSGAESLYRRVMRLPPGFLGGLTLGLLGGGLLGGAMGALAVAYVGAIPGAIAGTLLSRLWHWVRHARRGGGADNRLRWVGGMAYVFLTDPWAATWGSLRGLLAGVVLCVTVLFGVRGYVATALRRRPGRVNGKVGGRGSSGCGGATGGGITRLRSQAQGVRTCPPPPRPRATASFTLPLLLALLAGVAALALSVLDTAALKSAAEPYLPAGVAARAFKPELHDALRPKLRLVGVGVLLATAAGWRFRHAGSAWLAWAGRRARVEGRVGLADLLGAGRAAGPLLAALLLAALGLRLAFLFQPMRYDESVTYVWYASQPLYLLVCKYDFPNNHVFHSLCVHLSTGLFGPSPWAIRLPVLLAGALLAPATFAAARPLAGPVSAAVAAGLVAGSSILVEYSTNARGYMLLALVFVLMIGVGSWLLRTRSLLGWVGLAALAAVGFWTIPVMLFPYGVVMGWLAVEGALSPQVRRVYRGSFLRYLVGSGVLAMTLTATAYAPVLLLAGPDALFGNRFVAPLTWAGWAGALPQTLAATWEQWHRDLPAGLRWALPGGLAVALVTARRHPRLVSLLLVGVLWCGFLVVAKRINPFERVWLFALPLYLIGASAGLARLIELVPAGHARRGAVAAVAVAGLLGAGTTLWTRSVFFSTDTGTLRDGDDLAGFLRGQLADGDRVLARCPSDGVLLFYFDRRAVPLRHLIEPRDLPTWQGERLFVVVNKTHGQTLEEMVRRYRLAEVVALESGQMVRDGETATVHLFDTKQAAVAVRGD